MNWKKKKKEKRSRDRNPGLTVARKLMFAMWWVHEMQSAKSNWMMGTKILYCVMNKAKHSSCHFKNTLPFTQDFRIQKSFPELRETYPILAPTLSFPRIVFPFTNNISGIINLMPQTMCTNTIISPYNKTLEKEMAVHPSNLARRIPWTEEPGRRCKESGLTEQLSFTHNKT